MSAQVRTPTARTCERCGRSERWDDEVEAWQIAREDGDRQVGNPHCIHEWDINGAFNPVTGTINGK
ncbi:HEWD family protein [Halosolutus halophilus]|uniref:HEWD family protein n=1 Tax=Halosolutus halophilus TaxID=1552990 RepID=UPI0022350B06|nr:HEWD family protein [Halosolutus halophilus]